MKNFEGIIVTYHSDDIIPYPEYKGKPYFSIQYEENGEHHVGYGTYNPQVLSNYIEDYFNSRASIVEELETVRDKLLPKHRDGEVDEYNKGANDMLEEIIEHIDNRILELRGGENDT